MIPTDPIPENSANEPASSASECNGPLGQQPGPADAGAAEIASSTASPVGSAVGGSLQADALILAPDGARGQHRLERRNVFSDMQDKGFFLLFAVGGFAALFALKLYGSHPLYGAAAAIIILVGYASVSYCAGVFRLHADRLGDNCYYMGFLFTLASLSAALITLEEQSPVERSDVIDQLIGSFGVALFSTIAGILLRVTFMQMRQEVEDLEQEIRNDIQSGAMALKTQLGFAIAELEIFRVRTQQVIEDRLKESATGFGHAVARALAAVERATEQHADAAARFDGGVREVVSSVEQLTRQVAAVDMPPDVLTRHISAAAKQIDEVAATFARAAEADRTRQDAAVTALQAISDAGHRLADPALLGSARESANSLVEAFKDAAAGVREFQTVVAAGVESVSLRAAQARADAGAVADTRQALEQDLRASREALARLQGTLVDITEVIVERLGN